ncbi:Metallo-dependent phosphatase [Sporormia fimetaria CBS 119925]|uniref:Metallo-dependent phosphatase n=1 Tax=Sporormia fimetaria CBS 119925 TaxID=1340428 RepID=A0A6A6UY06_9PLEO|nr:Metallo-dependent phosphatase [Sporormia fimetaria CBS 119925]
MSRHNIVTDISIRYWSSPDPTFQPDSWRRIEKDLYLHTGCGKSAWLLVSQVAQCDLEPSSLVVTDVRISSTLSPRERSETWEEREAGFWVQRRPYNNDLQRAITGLDVLFGRDAVDPRPQWTLLDDPLQLPDAPTSTPIARLTMRRGASTPDPAKPMLRAREDGTFKIVQISDTHMVTGVGSCNDAMDADGNALEELEADPLTVEFLSSILDKEKPDLVVFTGDLLHHNILDSQTTLFKVVAPVIARSIPWAVVFGNHDDEGDYAQSRSAQMAIYHSLPFSLCCSGPDNVYGVGNYYVEILPFASPGSPIATLFFLDSHGQINDDMQYPDYEAIQPSQIKWFEDTSQALRNKREGAAQESSNCTASTQDGSDRSRENDKHSLLMFFHIPLPEFANDDNLFTVGGQRHEPTMAPHVNTHLYDALVRERVVAVGCGHDHVNDFCARVKRRSKGGADDSPYGPWLCHSGCAGFSAYCSYGPTRYYRRTRVWEIDGVTGRLKTWKRVEYREDRVDEVGLSRLVKAQRGL